MKKYSLILLVILLSFRLYSQNCLPGWAYYQELTFDHSSGADSLFNVQLTAELNTADLLSQGKIRSNLSDLRVVMQDCTPVPFYVDSAANSSQNRIWVKVPLVPAQENITLRVYYGNPNVNAVASGDDTFLFFDDFSGDSVDMTKWEPVGEYAQIDIVDNALRYSSTYSSATGARFKYLRSSAVFSESVWMDFRIRQANSQEFGFSSDDSLLQRYMLRYQLPGDTIRILAVMSDTISNGYATITDFPRVYIPRETFQTIRLKAKISDNNKFTLEEIYNLDNGSENTSGLEFPFFDMSGFHFMLTSFSNSQYVYLDHIKVWPAVENRPEGTAGAEVNNPVFVGIEPDMLVGLKIYPNPATDKIQIEWTDSRRVESVKLLDITGKVVLEKITPIGLLNVENLPNGLYLVQLFHQGKIVGNKRVELIR
ncbi:MAG: DUF2341 domain-containing protein [Bacteroidia bacterium]|nr:DUF2341 domain-containing protein [Bacteroidia bacterium]